ncbi:MAG: response regulator [Desulfatiglans sp.]|jgi:DNA-binding NtrC family response regulator|nr:response regulator [Desulfatiglans sp.]
MEHRILFVDDEPNILEGYKRQLRKQYDVVTAEGGERGLDMVKNNGPFSVVVSDLKMPGIDGNHFLALVKEVSPETTRILLTGYADLKSAIEAINNGNIFRLLTKPCDRLDLVQALESGIELYNENMSIKTGAFDVKSLSSKKVLIADDDPVIVRVLQKVLRDIPALTVLTAEDGKKAITILDKENIDLLIADIQMPHVNGLQLLSYVSKNLQGLRVIVLTANGSEKIENTIKSIGSYLFYEKPMDLNVFKDAVIRELRSGNTSQIHGINISSFLQLIDIEGKICTLTVRSHGNVGYLYFRNGELIAAETGNLRGEKAAMNIINWNNSVIEIADMCKKNKREIDKPLMKLLMESARIKDEESEAAEK